MQVAGLVLGILAFLGLFIGFIPCLGALNWLNIPIAVVGLVVSFLGYSRALPGESRGKAVAGMVLCGVAVVLGMLRLMLGGGVL